MAKRILQQEIQLMTEPIFNDYDGKDQRILDALMPYARRTNRANLTDVEINYASRQTSICLLMLPEWAVSMVPYNIARLAAITKNAGYKTYAYDLNIAAFKASRKNKWPGIDFDPWDKVYNTRWMIDEEYYAHIHPHLRIVMDKYVEKIVELNPTVIGFTVYDCNLKPIQYMVSRFREALPNSLIALGGPSCHRAHTNFGFDPDYIVSGEGEELILTMLAEIESGVRHTKTKLLRQDINQRINLDELPAPDYSHFDFNDYQLSNGANMEFSRGCIAKCTFCDETHFWKFRDRSGENVLNEVIKLYADGITNFWFLDSLVNGNIKQLRGFCKGIIASGMKIKWTGWARCDSRMDLDYYKDLAASGCDHLSYGVESGSNKVLKDMAKGIVNTEIEQNFKDSKSVGVGNVIMLIFGFPTEEPIDVYDTMTMLWRIRYTGIRYISTGIGCFVAEDNILGQNKEKYNISHLTYGNSHGMWITSDFKNSKVHRLIRIKIINILINNLTSKGMQYNLTIRHNLNKDYKFIPKHTTLNEIEYENFDFNICKPNLNPFADSLVNEIWPLLRILYKTRGAYSIDITFDSQKDTHEFSRFLGDNLDATIKFEIDDNGNWKADFDYKYVQKENAWQYEPYEQKQTNALKRIRILSDKEDAPLWPIDTETGKNLEKKYNDTLDFSFEYKFNESGKW